MSRTVEIGTRRFTTVQVTDEPGQGGACHEYKVVPSKRPMEVTKTPFAEVHFQNGPVKEFDVNGCHNEDLLAIVIDRLQSFQDGAFRCRENALALTHLETALLWLGKRTTDRINRGVEGTNVV